MTGWKRILGVAMMYNLTVQQDHTFVVGAGQWIVHNVCIDTKTHLNDLKAQLDAGMYKKDRNQKQLASEGPGSNTQSISDMYDGNGSRIGLAFLM